jgi:LEA14-like dessication related protein
VNRKAIFAFQIIFKMRKSTILLLVTIIAVLLSSCGKFEKIAIHGMKDFKFRGMKNGKLLISITLDIENPNNRKITISSIHFKTWLKNRELGTIKNSEKIVLAPKSRTQVEVPIEIVLRTAADAFKLMGLKEDILDQLIIEGYIKGRAMCFSKKIVVEKQPFTELAKSYKNHQKIKDEQQSDSLKVK